MQNGSGTAATETAAPVSAADPAAGETMNPKIIELPQPVMTRARALAILRLRFTDAQIAAMLDGRTKVKVKTQ